MNDPVDPSSYYFLPGSQGREAATRILPTASARPLVDFSARHHRRLFRYVVEIREDDLDRDFLKMLKGKERSSHIRGSQATELGE